MDRKDFAMKDWNELPSIDMKMVSEYEAEAHRLRAEAFRDFIKTAGRAIARLFSAGSHGAAQPSK